MSAILVGLALGLNAASPAIASDQNPHMLAADRHYQDLVYEARPVFRDVLRADPSGNSRLVLRQIPRTSSRAEADAVSEVR